MDILVAILIIALVGAVAYIVLQRRPRGAPGVERPHSSPLGRRGHGVRHADPMAAAVHEHAQATDPADVVVAEQRLQAQARQVAAGLGASNGASAAYANPAVPAQPAAGPPIGQPAAGGGQYAPASAAASSDPNLDRDFDPVTGERIGGYEDPANDPRLNDPKYDGRLAADWVDPAQDERLR